MGQNIHLHYSNNNHNKTLHILKNNEVIDAFLD